MNHLDKLESKSIHIIREAYGNFKNLAMLWSIGKDSTVLVWLCRKAFFGEIPFPVVHLDTSFMFQELYDFRDKFVKDWGLNLIIAKNNEALKGGVCPDDKLKCCTCLKTNALKMALAEHGFDALILGIRRDEHGIRAKERVFSPRDASFTWDYENQAPELWDQYKSSSDDNTHLRVHPLLDWTELDIWQYIKRENLPVISLYFAKNGKRLRSLGCEPCCTPVPSNASTVDEIIEELKTTKVGERSGRAQDKERAYMMQKLRSLGYM